MDPRKNPELLDQFVAFFFHYAPEEKHRLAKSDAKKKIFETKEEAHQYFTLKIKETDEEHRDQTFSLPPIS